MCHYFTSKFEIRRYTFLLFALGLFTRKQRRRKFSPRIRSSTRSRGTGKRNSRVGTIPTFNHQSKIPCMELASFSEMSKVAREFLTFEIVLSSQIWRWIISSISQRRRRRRSILIQTWWWMNKRADRIILNLCIKSWIINRFSILRFYISLDMQIHDSWNWTVSNELGFSDLEVSIWNRFFYIFLLFNNNSEYSWYFVFEVCFALNTKRNVSSRWPNFKWNREEDSSPLLLFSYFSSDTTILKSIFINRRNSQWRFSAFLFFFFSFYCLHK